MFTGIVEAVGTIVDLRVEAGTHRARISAPQLAPLLHLGDSIAVSGVCLTAIEIGSDAFTADLTAETWQCTSFSRVAVGSKVNLELPLRADAYLGGHMVQGHTDGVGRFVSLEPVNGGQDYWLTIEVPQALARYVVFKGSIAIEGISLTVARFEGNRLSVAIVPHTCEVTNLNTLKPGDPVNLETDIAARYIEKWTGREEEIVPVVATDTLRYAIVVARFNSLVTDRLLEGALDTFRRAGVTGDRIKVVHVPGAYEIPVTAKLLCENGNYDAIVCLGCVIRGDTLHYELVANETAHGITRSALDSGIPHIFEVLATDTVEQALNRAGLKGGNKGAEAASAAMEMAALRASIQGA